MLILCKFLRVLADFFVKTPLILQDNNVIIIHAGYRRSAEIECKIRRKVYWTDGNIKSNGYFRSCKRSCAFYVRYERNGRCP